MKHRYFLIAIINLCCLVLLLNGRQFFSKVQAYSFTAAPLLIEAVHYDGYSYQEADEAIALRNLSSQSVDIGGWLLTDANTSASKIPAGTQLQPHQLIWLTGDADAFRQQFGFAPGVTLAPWPGFANHGDEVLLLDQNEQLVDAVVYGDGDTSILGWAGTAVQPYTVLGVFGNNGQILFRKSDTVTGLPSSDSDSAVDWAQAISDPYAGRRVRFPGWDLQEFFFPVRSEQPASLTIAVAPDNALETVVETINKAQNRLQITTLTFENLAIADALVKAATRGVAIEILLEGSPVGGITDLEKAVCKSIEYAGGQCWFMISDQENRIYDRYQFMHAKYMIIDSELVLISSENLSPNSMPDDDKGDGTWGRRGTVLTTGAPEIVEALRTVFARDLDPANHSDLIRWQADHPKYGAPPPDFAPIQSSGGVTYTVRFPQAASFHDARMFELQQAPENLLRDKDGILGLVGSAKEGDTLLLQQLQERPHWGKSSSSRIEDPNVRLETIINAARRGVSVRFLLDDFFDNPASPTSNAATCEQINAIARDERLHLECRRANPSGLGIHNKMILAHIGGRGYIQIGSWNGSELASKGNREIALLVQSDSAYDYLAEMFEGDWPHHVYLPALAANYRGYATHALIGEVVYDPYGPDETEFIEIVNPTLSAIDLGGYSIGDAVSNEDFEDVRRFPENTSLRRGEIIVVSTSAVDFFELYHLWPDFEILDTTPLVADLIDDPNWGDTAALLRLGNQGDEVILRNESDKVVDVVTYGSGSYPGQPACPLLMSAGHSLERFPYWRDSDNCPMDFRDWPFPSPGKLP